MRAPAQSLRCLIGVYGLLLGLLALTAGARFLPSGAWSTPLSLLIALGKAALIYVYFMRLRSQPGLVRVFALAAFFWLAVMLTLTSADFFTRGLR